MNEESTYVLLDSPNNKEDELIYIEFRRYVDGEIWIFSISCGLSELINSNKIAEKATKAYNSFLVRPTDEVDGVYYS